MFEDDEIRLKHILDAAREAVGFTEGHCREDLDTDRKLSLSLVRLLEIIGEAAKGITAEFRQDHSELPWKSMVGMRDRLIHGYFFVNLIYKIKISNKNTVSAFCTTNFLS